MTTATPTTLDACGCGSKGPVKVNVPCNPKRPGGRRGK